MECKLSELIEAIAAKRDKATKLTKNSDIQDRRKEIGLQLTAVANDMRLYDVAKADKTQGRFDEELPDTIVNSGAKQKAYDSYKKAKTAVKKVVDKFNLEFLPNAVGDTVFKVGDLYAKKEKANSPLVLLTDLVDGKHVLKKEVKDVLPYAVMDWLANGASGASRTKDVQDMLGKTEDDTVTAEEYEAIKNVDGLAATLYQRAGGIMMSNLGFKLDTSKISPQTRDKLKTDLGILVAKVAEDMGYISLDVGERTATGSGYAKGQKSLSSDVFSGNVTSLHSTSVATYRLNKEKQLDKDAEKTDEAIEEAYTKWLKGLRKDVKVLSGRLEAETRAEQPSFEKYDEKMPVKLGGIKSGFSTVDKEHAEAVKKMRQVEMHLTDRRLKLFKSLIGTGGTKEEGYDPELLKLFGAYTDYNHINNTQLDSVMGKNRAIMEDFDYAMDFIKDVEEEGSNTFYMDYVVNASNLRFTSIANTFDPQNKKLHRFLTHYGDMVKLTAKNMTNFYMAIGQALGIDVDKQTSDKSVSEVKKLIDTIRKAREKGETDEEIALEYIGKNKGQPAHAMAGIAEVLDFLDYQVANSSNGEGFEVSLPLETDAITSGYILKLLQMPILDGNLNNQLRKGGIITSDYGVKEDRIIKLLNRKDKDGNLIITSKGKAIKKGDSIPTVALIELRKELIARNKKSGKDIDADIIESLYDAYEYPASLVADKLKAYLKDNKESEPIIARIGKLSEDGYVSLTRAFMKDPFMIFNYGAGINRIVLNKVETFMADLYSDLMGRESDSDIRELDGIMTMAEVLNASIDTKWNKNRAKEATRKANNEAIKKDLAALEQLARYSVADGYNLNLKKEKDLAYIKKNLKGINTRLAKLAGYVGNNSYQVEAKRDLTQKLIGPNNTPLKLHKEFKLGKAGEKAVKAGVQKILDVSIGSTFKEEYKVLMDATDTINTAMVNSFRLFKKRIDRAITAYEDKNGRAPSEQWVEKKTNEMIDAVPMLRTVFGGEKPKLMIADVNPTTYSDISGTGNHLTETGQTWVQFGGNEKTDKINGQAQTYKLVEAYSQSAVLAIHHLDSSIIAKVLAKYDMMGIHDAGLYNINDVDAASKDYNKNVLEVSKRYNMSLEVLRSLVTNMNAAKEGDIEAIDNDAIEQAVKEGDSKTAKAYQMAQMMEDIKGNTYGNKVREAANSLSDIITGMFGAAISEAQKAHRNEVVLDLGLVSKRAYEVFTDRHMKPEDAKRYISTAMDTVETRREGIANSLLVLNNSIMAKQGTANQIEAAERIVNLVEDIQTTLTKVVKTKNGKSFKTMTTVKVAFLKDSFDAISELQQRAEDGRVALFNDPKLAIDHVGHEEAIYPAPQNVTKDGEKVTNYTARTDVSVLKVAGMKTTKLLSALDTDTEQPIGQNRSFEEVAQQAMDADMLNEGASYDEAHANELMKTAEEYGRAMKDFSHMRVNVVNDVARNMAEGWFDFDKGQLDNDGKLLGEAAVFMNTSGRPSVARNAMTNLEVLVHEMTHGVLEWGLDEKNTATAHPRAVFQQLYERAREETKKLGMWKVLLPENGSIYTEKEELIAKNMYEHVFGLKPDGRYADGFDVKEGWREFGAHLKTNKEFRAAMEKVNIKHNFLKEVDESASSLQQFINKILGAITSAMHKVFNVTNGIKPGDNVYTASVRLMNNMIALKDKEYALIYDKNALGKFDKAVNLLGLGFDKANEAVRPATNFINKALFGDTDVPLSEKEIHHLEKIITKYMPKDGDGKLVWMLKALRMLPATRLMFRGKARLSAYNIQMNKLEKDLKKALANAHLGGVARILASVTSGGEMTVEVTDRVSQVKAKLDRARDELSKGAAKDILDGFEKVNLASDENLKYNEVLNNVVLTTDFQALGEGVNALEGYLKNDVDKELKKYTKLINGLEDSERIVREADSMVDYMLHGTGLISNAKQIMLGFGSPHAIIEMAKKPEEQRNDTAKIIDKYSTYKAFSLIDAKEKELLLELIEKDREGVESFVDVAAGLQREAANENEVNDEFSHPKGFVRDSFERFADVEYVPVKVEDKELMKRLGFELASTIKAADGDKLGDVGVWVKKNAVFTSMQDGAMAMYGKVSYGYSLHQKVDAIMDGKSYNAKKTMYNKMFNSLLSSWYSGTMLKGVSPMYNSDGEITDFVYNMSREDKINKLGMETKATVNVHNTYSLFHTRETALKANEEFVDYLAEDFRKNYVGNEDEFIEVQPDEVRKNKIGLKQQGTTSWLGDTPVGELWAKIPKDTRKYITKAMGDQKLMVRKSIAMYAFGYTELSIAQSKIAQKVFGPVGLDRISKLERGWDNMVSLAKNTIIVKLPQVAINNIKSNVNLWFLQGFNIGRATKIAIQTRNSLNMYQRDHKERSRLKRKNKNHGYDNRIAELTARLESNINHKFITKGMYQNIAEDIDLGADSNNLIENKLKDMVKKLPRIAQVVISGLFLTSDTKYYKFMEQMVLESDYLAKVATVQMVKEKAFRRPSYIQPMLTDSMMKKGYGEELSTINWHKPVTNIHLKQMINEAADRIAIDNHVNYNKAMLPWVQYLDKKSALPFIKYWANILKVDMRILKDYPVNVIAVLLAEHAMGGSMHSTMTSLVGGPNVGLNVMGTLLEVPAFKAADQL